MSQKQAVLFINMAKGFGGGEFYTEQLIKNLEGYQCYFLGKKSGKLTACIQQNLPEVKVISLWSAIKLALSEKNLIVHALDGRGAHFAGIFKRFFKTISVITRQVNFAFKRKSSQKAYENADMLVGVSQSITQNLAKLNQNAQTVYGCLKPLQENKEFEQQFFANPPHSLKIAHIGNFQTVKNFPLTIELAKQNPDVYFYLVGAGELENELKIQSKGFNNIYFIPFTPYIGSVLKNVDLLIVPSHSEGLGMVILEGYQYQVPSIAHATGGIPEIIEQEKTGFLVSPNQIEQYQAILDRLLAEPTCFAELRQNITAYLAKKDFSAQRMAREYEAIYRQVLKNH